MITFRFASHSVKPGVQIVEIMLDGAVVAVIYPASEKGMKLVSAHFDGVAQIEHNSRLTLPISSVSFEFDPHPYVIRGAKGVRIGRG